jgi:hypothetical protein
LYELKNLFAHLDIDWDTKTDVIIARFPVIWSKFLDLDSDATKLGFKDRPAQMCFLSALYTIDKVHSNEIRYNFKEAGTWYERSIAEIKLRLSGRLYKYARRIWKNFKNADDAGACLEYSLEVSDLRPE